MSGLTGNVRRMESASLGKECARMRVAFVTIFRKMVLSDRITILVARWCFLRTCRLLLYESIVIKDSRVTSIRFSRIFFGPTTLDWRETRSFWYANSQSRSASVLLYSRCLLIL